MRTAGVAAWWMMALSCATSEAARVEEGATCRQQSECSVGLVCKGARCVPPRSAPGGVCVTEAGCADGLACVGGRCSVGPASVAECEQACTHVKALYQREVLTELQAQPPAVVDEHQKLVLSMAEEVKAECLAACPGRLTREEVDCYLRSERSDLLKICQ